ncbi:putative acetyltransferase [Panicum miliaceum]|uniref:Acetyltransferase n=1 Tax=Panicum miliaceum TaxID=4540 RepID=A0A3L6PQJ2_PANMI|nr:putative acetyltransferase [Panicum miliaceum]
MLDGDYIKKGLLFAPPPFFPAHLVDHLHASLADALVAYYPVAGRFSTNQKRDGKGSVIGCSVSIESAGQGAEILHAVVHGVAIADVVPPDADVPRMVHSFSPLDGAANYDGHELPLLADGVFIGFAYSHALSDSMACWNFLNAWAEIALLKLAPPGAPRALKPPLLERWSPDGGATAPVLLPYADLAVLVQRQPAPDLHERMLHFSSESLMALKERARRELLEAGDKDGAATVTRFQTLTSLLWRCVTRARWQQVTMCGFASNNRHRLRPPLPTEYFGHSVYALSTETVDAPALLARGHGWAVAAVGARWPRTRTRPSGRAWRRGKRSRRCHC